MDRYAKEKKQEKDRARADQKRGHEKGRQLKPPTHAR